jgi:hypothetical protein
MNGIPPVPRYLDIISIGLLTNFAVLLMMLQSQFARRFSVAWAVVTIAWIWGVGYNLQRRMGEVCSNALPSKAAASFTQDALLRAYVATGDLQYLNNKSTADIAYYAGPDALAGILNDPVVRPILAHTIREPLPVTWPTGSVFHNNDVPRGFRLCRSAL